MQSCWEVSSSRAVGEKEYCQIDHVPWFDGTGCRVVLTKVYFYLDESQTTGNDSICDGDNWVGDAQSADDDDNDERNDSDDGVGGDAPNSTHFSTKGGKATGMCLTNRCHFSVCLFSSRSQMTSKCSKHEKVAHQPQASMSMVFFTTFWRLFVICYWTDTRQHGIASFYTMNKTKNPQTCLVLIDRSRVYARVRS